MSRIFTDLIIHNHEPISAHGQMWDRFASSGFFSEFFAVNHRRLSREAPLGLGVKKDGCFRRLQMVLFVEEGSLEFS